MMARTRTYLAEHPGQFHWDQGVRRLALGAFMVGGEARGPGQLAGLDVAPEEVRPISMRARRPTRCSCDRCAPTPRGSASTRRR